MFFLWRDISPLPICTCQMIVDHYRPWHEILDYGQLAYATQEVCCHMGTESGTLPLEPLEPQDVMSDFVALTFCLE